MLKQRRNGRELERADSDFSERLGHEPSQRLEFRVYAALMGNRLKAELRTNGRRFCKASVALVLKHLLDLLSQLQRVLVAVNGSGMLHRRFEHFFFGAGNLE